MRPIIIILLAFCSISLYAEDTIPAIASTDTMSIAIDTDTTAVAATDTLVDLPIFFDEALAWLDTTECYSDTIITELPDSVYKARLQTLPFVIEVPYNEIVRR